MAKYTIDDLRKNKMIVYEYVRGSHLYGLNTETSDEDRGGVFVLPKEDLLGLRSNYVEQVSDEKGDTVFYEFGRWIELLLKSNPTALESLFVPKRCIIGKVHPMIQYIIGNRDLFLSKECFKTLTGYAVSQIGKARGLNKKIVNPITTRKGILDFCYTFKNQGSQPIKDFLNENNLNQKYCGLVNIPNMNCTYGVYYDFAAYFKFEFFDKGFFENSELTEELFHNWCFDMRFRTVHNDTFMDYEYAVKTYNRIINNEYFNYSGIVNPIDEVQYTAESNDVRLCSIPKGESPICAMTYNKDGYQNHCREYKEYKDWEQNRNPIRYESNLGKNYDGKNMCHCMRLTRMGKELALGQGFNVERTYDKDFLLSIKRHEIEYDDIIAMANKEKHEMDEAIKTCLLPDFPDYDKINQLTIDARNIYYASKIDLSKDIRLSDIIID